MHFSPFLTAAVLLLTVAPSGDYQYSPEQDSSIRRTFSSTLDLELSDSSTEVLVNGEEQDAQQPEFEVSVHQESSLIVLDTFEKVTGGQILILTRAFETMIHSEEVEVTVDGDEQDPQEILDESELEGRVVRFQFDEDSKEWEKSWADDEDGDEVLLEGLLATCGYEFLLPDEDSCEVGDKWSLSGDSAVAAFSALLDPLGELHMFSENEDPEEELETSRLFWENLSVEEFECQLKSLEDGQAVIIFKVEGGTAFDQDPELPEEMQAMGMQVTIGFEMETVLEGELVWDMGAHHMTSFECTAELEIINSNSQTGSGGVVEFEATSSQTFEGELTYEVSLD